VDTRPPPPLNRLGGVSAAAPIAPTSASWPSAPSAYKLASRSASSVWNPVSLMPSGPKILLAMNWSSRSPETTSTMRPSTSVDTE
jgi:hypothetical protein